MQPAGKRRALHGSSCMALQRKAAKRASVPSLQMEPPSHPNCPPAAGCRSSSGTTKPWGLRPQGRGRAGLLVPAAPSSCAAVAGQTASAAACLAAAWPDWQAAAAPGQAQAAPELAQEMPAAAAAAPPAAAAWAALGLGLGRVLTAVLVQAGAALPWGLAARLLRWPSCWACRLLHRRRASGAAASEC